MPNDSSCRDTLAPSTASDLRSSTPRRVYLRLDGLLGKSCAKRVERAILAIPGVNDVKINVLLGCCDVGLSGPALSTRYLAEAVHRAGYFAATLPAQTTFAEACDHAFRARLREQRQAMGQAVAMAGPILALGWLAPVLRSGGSGGGVWPQVIQVILCLLLLGSSACAVILLGGLRSLIFRVPSYDVLPALALIASFVAGVVGLVVGKGGAVHFGDLAIVAVLLGVGRYAEWRVRRGAALRMRASRGRVAWETKSGALEAKCESGLTGDVLGRPARARKVRDRAAVSIIRVAIVIAIGCAMVPLVLDETGWSSAVRRGIAVFLVVSPAALIMGTWSAADYVLKYCPGGRPAVWVTLYHGLGIIAAVSGVLPPGGAVLVSACVLVWLTRLHFRTCHVLA